MGFLRFVLQSEGYQVVAQASTASELARVLTDEQPDVVVLDDGIGATAVQMTHEISPSSKVILVWPGAVVPIGGDARVEPSEVLRSLGPAVARAVGPVSATFETISKPSWVDRVRKDPTTLRERLDEGGGLPSEHPSVTELQRQARFDEPVGDDDAPEGEEPLAPVVPLARLSLPPAVWASTIDLDELAEADEEVVVAAGSEASDWNRRLGMIALGGAVAASAVVVALALGPRGRQGIVSASGTFPRQPGSSPAPGGALVGDLGRAATVTGLDGLFPVPPPTVGKPTVGGPHGGGANGGGGTGGVNTGGGGNTGSGGTGGGGGVTRMPGNSALHNPFGGPPGQSPSTGGGTAGPGNSAAAHEHAAQRGNSGSHASSNGLAHRHPK